jgi:hypothetical protein
MINSMDSNSSSISSSPSKKLKTEVSALDAKLNISTTCSSPLLDSSESVTPNKSCELKSADEAEKEEKEVEANENASFSAPNSIENTKDTESEAEFNEKAALNNNEQDCDSTNDN